MILVRKSGNNEVSVIQDSDGWQITYEGKSFHFKQSMIEFTPDVAYLRYAVDSGMFLAWASETGESRSGLAYSYLRNGQSFSHGGEDLVVAFFVGEERSIHLFVNGKLSESSTFNEAPVETEIANPLEAFSANLPEAEGFVQRIRAKQRLLRKVNELDVLAAMEAQLDLLTSLVLSIKPDADIQKAVDGCLVTEVHDKETLVLTIKRQKQYLRELQKTYFAARGSIDNGKPTAA